MSDDDEDDDDEDADEDEDEDDDNNDDDGEGRHLTRNSIFAGPSARRSALCDLILLICKIIINMI